MNIVTLKNGKTVDIDTVEGSKEYLKDAGYDLEKVLADGRKVLEEIKKKLNEETRP